MTAKKTEKSETYFLDRFGQRHDIAEKDVAPELQPALPAAQTD